MSKVAKVGLILNTAVLLLVLIGLAHAQRPPELDQTAVVVPK